MAFYQDEGPGVIVGYLPLEIAKTRSMMQYVSVGNVFENLGTLVVDSTAAFRSSLLLMLRSWLVAFYNFVHTLPVYKAHFIKRLSTEIELESRVPKN